MILEERYHDNLQDKSLILIPTKEESRMIDSVLGRNVVEDSGLICKVEGEVRIADGYGPHYISLHTVESRKELKPEGETMAIVAEGLSDGEAAEILKRTRSFVEVVNILKEGLCSGWRSTHDLVKGLEDTQREMNLYKEVVFKALNINESQEIQPLEDEKRE